MTAGGASTALGPDAGPVAGAVPESVLGRMFEPRPVVSPDVLNALPLVSPVDPEPLDPVEDEEEDVVVVAGEVVVVVVVVGGGAGSECTAAAMSAIAPWKIASGSGA